MDLSSTTPTTAWQNSRLDARAGPRKLLFGRMYEDAAIELNTFPSGGRIFCIASAGCTAMALAPHHEVVAIDINPFQLAYVRRRLAGGPMERGSADRVVGLARAIAPLAGWERQTIRAFLDLEDCKEQIRFWRHNLNTRRFRAGFDLLFSRSILRLIYSASLLDCLPRKVGSVMRGRMERCFALHSNRANPYARALFLGDMESSLDLANKGNIQLHCADAAAFLESQPAAGFNGFSLSNILDGANPAYRRRLLEAVRHAAAPNAIVVLRSFREPRIAMETNRAAADRSLLWGIVDIRPASELHDCPSTPARAHTLSP